MVWPYAADENASRFAAAASLKPTIVTQARGEAVVVSVRSKPKSMGSTAAKDS